MQLTAGQEFHHRMSAAIEARDLPTLASLYHSDAVLVSVSTGQVFRGVGAILASVEKTLEVAGPVKPVALDSFVEYGDVLCVEATQSTRFAQVETYDVFVFQAGAVRYQFSGTISPRQAAAPLSPGVPTTPARQFHSRLYAAIQSQDFAALRTLYRPDAIQISASLGTVRQGRDAIVDSLSQEWRTSGPPRLKALTRFVEMPDVICTEETITQKFSLMAGDGPIFDVHIYELILLQAGAMRCYFSGMISPRPAELKPVLEKLQGQLGRAWERSLDALIRPQWR